MSAFDASFVALTGDTAQIKVAANGFRGYSKKIPTGSSYTMDHTALTYLLNRQGQIRVALRHAQTAADCSADIQTLLAEKPHWPCAGFYPFTPFFFCSTFSLHCSQEFP